MFTSFTGSSRRPRQVNLSGRNANPFAQVGSGAGSHSALVSAQQERMQRQHERDRLKAAKTIQRRWRGFQGRRALENEFRARWDASEAQAHDAMSGDPETPYESEAAALGQLRRLILFARHSNPKDAERLFRYCRRRSLSAEAGIFDETDSRWAAAYVALQKIVLETLDSALKSFPGKCSRLLHCLIYTTNQAPRETAQNLRGYHNTTARLLQRHLQQPEEFSVDEALLLDATTTPIRNITAGTDVAYEMFASKVLTIPELSQTFDGTQNTISFRRQVLGMLTDAINPKILARSLSNLVDRGDIWSFEELADSMSRLRLLGCFIHIHRQMYGSHNWQSFSSSDDFIEVVSSLLPTLELVRSEHRIRPSRIDSDEFDSDESRLILGDFLTDQIDMLVQQESVGSLLFNVTTTDSPDDPSKTGKASRFASYALTLIRCFPKKANDIRMWLFIGSSKLTSRGATRNVPVIKYFWDATKETTVYSRILNDERQAIKLLEAQFSGRYSWRAPNSGSDAARKTDGEWEIVLIFMELYTLLLTLMDDVEFFSADDAMRDASRSSWTTDNALPLKEIRDLTVFLKNLGFTMYFQAAEIVEEKEEGSTNPGLGNYFNVSSSPDTPSKPAKSATASKIVGGVAGSNLDHVRGVVTGLLRMIYERDSRRKFLPNDHWLMTSRLRMDDFISDVVREDERMHQYLGEGSDDDSDVSEEEDLRYASLVGTSHAQRARNIERLQRRQQQISKKRNVQMIVPRLAILQNLPFFIPFATRVQIFRELIVVDQTKRRNGYTDPDQWRMVMMNTFNGDEPVARRHHATIRREHEFEDAFEQFYPLKDGLKEPIQITFKDTWGQDEVGIDGGGVTKEFLTSTTSQAFALTSGFNLFVMNDDNMLFPNPTAVEEKKERLRRVGYQDGSAEFKSDVSKLLQKYEFLGRIIGKCLYEGILVDIGFAGFFLLKWALTGGVGSAPKETGYRANLNDLRELDEALYRGLLQLKNYDGDVEDFALNFTVTDEFTVDYTTGEQKVVTWDLRPNGASIPVTNGNRLAYISYVARYRLQIQPLPQTSAFLRGLSAIIQPSWLSMFNQTELQTLVGGSSSSIDLQDLRRNTIYSGLYSIGDDGLEHPSVRMFWQVMEELPESDKAEVLRFVTSTPRAPLLGFSNLSPSFSIRDSGTAEDRLPSASTCINLLKLPTYSNKKLLKEKLLYAVLYKAGFDLS